MISVERSAPAESLQSKAVPVPISGPTMAASPKVFTQQGEPLNSAPISTLTLPANNTSNSPIASPSSAPISNSTVTNSATVTSVADLGPPPGGNSLTHGPAAFDGTRIANEQNSYTGAAGHSQYLTMSVNSNKSEACGQSANVGFNCTTAGLPPQVTPSQASYSQPPGVGYTAAVPGSTGQLAMHFPTNTSQNSHAMVSNNIVVSSVNGQNFLQIHSKPQEMRQNDGFGNCTNGNMTWQPNTSVATNNIAMSSQPGAKINTRTEVIGSTSDVPKVAIPATDRPFPCSECGKTFGSNRNLQRHICKAKKKNASSANLAGEMKDKMGIASDIKPAQNSSQITNLPPTTIANNSIGKSLPPLQNQPSNQTQPLPATNVSTQPNAAFKCDGCDRTLSSSRSLRRHRSACKATKDATLENAKSSTLVPKPSSKSTSKADTKCDEKGDITEANSKVADVVDSVVEKLRQQSNATKDEAPLPSRDYTMPPAPTAPLHTQIPQTSIVLTNGHYMQQSAPTHHAPTSISYYPQHHYVAPSYYHPHQPPQMAQVHQPMQVAPPPQASQWGSSVPPPTGTTIMAPMQVNSMMNSSHVNGQHQVNATMGPAPSNTQYQAPLVMAPQTNSKMAPNQTNCSMRSPTSTSTVIPATKQSTETSTALPSSSTPVQQKTNPGSGGGGKNVYRHLCPECDKQYSCRKNVKRHRVSVHKVPFEEAQTGPIKKIKLSEPLVEAASEAKTQTEQNTSRQNPAPTAKQPSAPTAPAGSKPVGVTGRPNHMQQNNYIQSPPQTALPPTSVYSQQYNNNPNCIMMAGQAPYSAPPALNNSPHAGRPTAFSFGPSTETSYYSGTQNTWNSPPPQGSVAKSQPYPQRWSQNSYDSHQNPPYSAMQPMYMASPPAHQYQTTQFNYRHASVDNGGSQSIFGSPTANYPDGGFYSASHNLADLDYWDQIKSNVDTPLTSRSRDDDLEMARIVEDLKRSAEGDPTYPAPNEPLLPSNGTFHELQPSSKIEDKSVVLSGLNSGNQYQTMENAARKSTELVLAEADTTFWEEDGEKSASRHEVLQGNSPPVLTSLKPVMLISSPEKIMPVANTSPVGKVNVNYKGIANPPMSAITVNHTIEKTQISEPIPSKSNVVPEAKKAKAKKPANGSGTTTRAPIGSGTYPCDACNRMLSTDYSLKRHRQICQKYKDRQLNPQEMPNDNLSNNTKNDTIGQKTTSSPTTVGSLDPDSTSALWQQNHSRSTESSPPTNEGNKPKS